MKRKIFKFIGLALFAGAIVFNIYMSAKQNQTQTSKVTLQNIAALTAAADEDGGWEVTYTCYDAQDFNDNSGAHYKRVCGAYMCTAHYFDSYLEKTECTVTYDK